MRRGMASCSVDRWENGRRPRPLDDDSCSTASRVDEHDFTRGSRFDSNTSASGSLERHPYNLSSTRSPNNNNSHDDRYYDAPRYKRRNSRWRRDISQSRSVSSPRARTRRYRSRSSSSRRHWRRRSSRSGSMDRTGSSEGRRRRETGVRDTEEWRRRRRREDLDAVSRKMDHYKEPPSTTVVVLRQVPLDVNEQDVEASVRSVAISLGFSPPNFVKVVPVNPKKASSEVASTTSAYVDFPSCDSAQVFYDACRRDFSVKGKRTFLEWPRCPAASVAALSAAQSAEHWASVIDSTERHRPASANSSESLGPGIPLPNLDAFSMDSKSGLPFNKKAGLYYDAQSQHYISTYVNVQSLTAPNTLEICRTGIYYVKSSTSARTLVPVHKLTGALGTAGNPTGLMVAKPLVLSEVQKRLEQEKLEEESASEKTTTLMTTPVDSAVTKATAVASVLAAAQLAAKATKRIVKLKGSDGTTASQSGKFLNPNGDGVPLDGAFGKAGSSSTSGVEPQTIEALFGDVPFEEEPPKESNGGPQHQWEQSVDAAEGEKKHDVTRDVENGEAKAKDNKATEPMSQTKSVSSTLSGRPGLYVEQHVCFVCIQQFQSAEHLAKHQTESLFHKKNCQLQGIERLAVS